MKRAKKISLGIGILLAVLITPWVIIHFVDIGKDENHDPLEPGWQFYSKPTTLEPPGTVFRIDKSGRKYQVGEIELMFSTGEEVTGQIVKTVEIEVSTLARIFGKLSPQVGSTGKKIEKMRFEMIGTLREVTKDNLIDDLVKNFAKKVRYRKDNRYFVIREARSATELNYTLTENIVYELGGEKYFKELAKVKGDLFYKKGKEYSLNKKFPKRMRVMFLPEEIVMVGQSLSGGLPEFKKVPVKDMLIWTEE